MLGMEDIGNLQMFDTKEVRISGNLYDSDPRLYKEAQAELNKSCFIRARQRNTEQSVWFAEITL